MIGRPFCPRYQKLGQHCRGGQKPRRFDIAVQSNGDGGGGYVLAEWRVKAFEGIIIGVDIGRTGNIVNNG